MLATERANSSFSSSKLMSLLGATLFREDLTWHDKLWWRISKAVSQKIVDAYSCKTQANRYVLLRCRCCHAQVVADHNVYTTPEERREARRALLTWWTNPTIVDPPDLDAADDRREV